MNHRLEPSLLKAVLVAFYAEVILKVEQELLANLTPTVGGATYNVSKFSRRNLYSA